MVLENRPVVTRGYPSQLAVSEQLLGFTLLAALVVCVVGVGFKILQYWRTPAPFNIPLTPAPKTYVGMLLRLLRETVLFQSLFRANKWTWLLGWLMHLALVLLLLKHLFYVFDVPPFWVGWLMGIGHILFVVFVVSLSGLLVRRIAVARVRYISAPSDYLMLLLLLAIAVSGYSMHSGSMINLAEVKGFVQGLWQLEWRAFPVDIRLVVHILLVSILLFIFPFSKLLHAPGLFFSPTRNQVDNAREKQS